MSEIIYVLTNEAMPGYVKVGKTSTSLAQRMKELSSSTSVPLPFTCFYACTVNNAAFVERQIHDAFDNSRSNKRREFFQIAPARIVAALKLAALEDITPIDDVDMLPDDKQALEKIRSDRRQQFRFSLADVPVGAELVFINDQTVKARVIDDRSIEINGKVTSLSGEATKLLGYKHNVQGTAYWLYNGEILDERRKRIEIEGAAGTIDKTLVQNEVVLQVGADGGSITLYGVGANDNWAFSLSVIDHSPSFINEQDESHDSKVVHSWEEALALLDRYQWHGLYPLEVHPSFRAKVLDAVTARWKSTSPDTEFSSQPSWNALCVPAN